MKRLYNKPCLTGVAEVALERDFLNPSIVENTSIVTSPQQVETYNFDSDQFNIKWEE